MSGNARLQVEGTWLVVNGEATQTRAPTLAALLDELGYGDRKVATAINGEFVPAKSRAGAVLAANDAVEIVSPRQGG